MAFEKFTLLARGGRSRNTNPQASILKSNGLASFNIATLIEYIKDSKFVFLYFDKDANKIGFEFTNEESPGIRKITINKKRCSCSIKNFLNHYHIDYSESKKYDLTFDEENGLYVIQL